jgi:nicotinamidase-related amidase
MPKTALVIADMLNDYDHEDGDALAESVKEQLAQIVEARDRAADAGTLIVFVNDNHDEWQAGKDELIEKALNGKHPELVEPIAPRDPVPFIAKGRHSVFYQTALDHVLRSSDVQHIVLTGQVTEQCVLYSALDAYIRGYDLTVPRDAVAHIDPDLAKAALSMMEANMHADLTPAAEVDFDGD